MNVAAAIERSVQSGTHNRGKSTRHNTDLDDVCGMNKEPTRDATRHGDGKGDRSREQHHICCCGARGMDMWMEGWGGNGTCGGHDSRLVLAVSIYAAALPASAVFDL